jgi:hypothetical protein
MRGYPKVIATKQDFLNLLAEPEFRDRALIDLSAVYGLKDDTVAVVKSSATDAKGQMTNVVTETIPAPNPLWKSMGFESRGEVLDISVA